MDHVDVIPESMAPKAWESRTGGLPGSANGRLGRSPVRSRSPGDHGGMAGTGRTMRPPAADEREPVVAELPFCRPVPRRQGPVCDCGMAPAASAIAERRPCRVRCSTVSGAMVARVLAMSPAPPPAPATAAAAAAAAAQALSPATSVAASSGGMDGRGAAASPPLPASQRPHHEFYHRTPAERRLDRQQRRGRSAKEFARGAGAAFVNITVTFPLNKLMFRQQLHGHALRDAFREMHGEGLKHVYRGLAPPLAQRTVSMSMMFGLYEYYRSAISDADVMEPHLAGHFAAAAAGTTEAVLAPLERIQTLLQTAKYNKAYDHMFDVARSLRPHGLGEFYRGIVPIVLRNSMTNVLFFGLREPLRDALPEPHACEGCHLLRSFVSGSVLGASLSTLFFPLNVAKSVMQKQVGGPHIGMLETLATVYEQRGGVAGMYRGVGLNLSRSLVSWGIINSVYDALGSVLGEDSD